jgi:hypothetical protein
MTIRVWTLVGVLWLVSLAAVGSITYAQSPQPAPALPNMMTGTDLGFVVEQQKGGIAFGQLMVRVDGQWRRAVGSARRGYVVPLAE